MNMNSVRIVVMGVLHGCCVSTLEFQRRGGGVL